MCLIENPSKYILRIIIDKSKGGRKMKRNMKFVKPATLTADIAACMLTPFKARVVTPCVVPALMAV